MKQKIPPKFETPPLSDEVERNMIMSFVECENLTERDLKCPNCKAPIAGIFSDATGYLRVKCQKCKANMILSLEYFRTMKGYSEYRKSGSLRCRLCFTVETLLPAYRGWQD